MGIPWFGSIPIATIFIINIIQGEQTSYQIKTRVVNLLSEQTQKQKIKGE